jgi:hypothetical protein
MCSNSKCIVPHIPWKLYLQATCSFQNTLESKISVLFTKYNINIRTLESLYHAKCEAETSSATYISNYVLVFLPD